MIINLMNTSELIFIGIKGSVVALNRATGDQVWVAELRGSDFVNVAVEGGRIIAMTHGEVYCLNPISGELLWHNRLKGFGLGIGTIASEDGLRTSVAALVAEKQRREQQASNSAGATVVGT